MLGVTGLLAVNPGRFAQFSVCPRVVSYLEEWKSITSKDDKDNFGILFRISAMQHPAH